MRYPILILCAAACAAAADPLSVPHDDNPDPNRSQIRQMQHETRPPASEHEGDDGSVSMSEDELIAQPDLLQNALDTAVARQQTGNIRFLLPLYRRLDEKRRDAVLEAYAESFLLREDGQYARAEEKLRAILAQNPGYAPVRLQLALTLSQSGQTREAAAEVAKVKAVPDLPPDTAAYLDSFSAYLKRERAWQFDANAYYIAERNVGRAPKEREYGPWRFPEPRTAHGLGYDASAVKTLPVKKTLGGAGAGFRLRQILLGRARLRRFERPHRSRAGVPQRQRRNRPDALCRKTLVRHGSLFAHRRRRAALLAQSVAENHAVCKLADGL